MSHVHLQMTDDLIDYVRAVSPSEPECLRKLREETALHPRARMQITPEQGHFFQFLIRLLNAKRTLEIGVFTGYSSTAVALALPGDGQIVACDISEEFTSVARRYWAEARVSSKIDLRLGPAVETLDRLIRDGGADTFDFAFIDADKERYKTYYERVLVLVRKGGVIALDNMLWSGRVLDTQSSDPETNAIQELNSFIKNDSRVWSCMLPIGDGLTLALKK